jgi:putrescine---pyruvate transaminase
MVRVAALERHGEELLEDLMALYAEHDIVGNARGKGLMAYLELVSDRETKSTVAKETMRKVGIVVHEAGAMVNTSGPNIVTSPPLVITASDMQRIISALGAGLSAAA